MLVYHRLVVKWLFVQGCQLASSLSVESKLTAFNSKSFVCKSGVTVWQFDILAP